MSTLMGDFVTFCAKKAFSLAKMDIFVKHMHISLY